MQTFRYFADKKSENNEVCFMTPRTNVFVQITFFARSFLETLRSSIEFYERK